MGPNDNRFGVVFATGQIFLRSGIYLDSRGGPSYPVIVLVRDRKDVDGEDDRAFDASIDVTINVIDVDDPGEVALTVEHPRVGQQISAELDDPDSPVSNLAWQWQTADTVDATTWTDVAGATTSNYTPTLADHGKFLRAQATYDDKHGTGKTVLGALTNAVPPRAANEPPEFNEGVMATRSVSEAAVTGARLGAAVVASDTDGDGLTYSLATGDDAANFIVDPATGELEVAAGALLDFEVGPSLSVVVQVTDGKDSGHNADTTIDDTITVTINLINADESGKVRLSTSRPAFHEAITASLTDPDGGTTSISWQWAKSHDGGVTWTDLDGATSDTYTPVPADTGALLRATATYTDAEGSGKSASLISSRTVRDPAEIDTSLDSLELEGISFEFHHKTFQYGVSTAFEDTFTTVTAVPAVDSGVTVEILPEDSRPAEDGHQIDLAAGNNAITVTVSHDESGASTSYLLRVNRPANTQNWSGGCSPGVVGNTAVRCISTPFAKIKMHMYGHYTVNWRKWDRKKPNVTGYTVTLDQYMYKTYHRGNKEISMSALANLYESCEFSEGTWNCEGPVRRKYYQDSDGQPTQRRVVMDNADQTQLGWSLDTTGLATAQETFYRWKGDANDPNNVPTEVAYRTKTSEVDHYHILPLAGNRELNEAKITIHGVIFADPFAP